MRYSEYLQSDQWQNLRLKKQKQAHRCFVCRKTPTRLNVHHARYGDLSKSKTADLRIAREECHRMFHVVKASNPLSTEAGILKKTRKIISALQHTDSGTAIKPEKLDRSPCHWQRPALQQQWMRDAESNTLPTARL
jgi:5-methylcytosine-specific restriction endonuclease McrA